MNATRLRRMNSCRIYQIVGTSGVVMEISVAMQVLSRHGNGFSSPA